MSRPIDKRFLVFDALGSVDRILGPSQSVTDRYLYEAFGKEVLKTGTTRNPFRWLGEIGYYTETETAGGVPIYVRARQYSPVQGRWLSVDPLDGWLWQALFMYVENQLMRLRDPSGRDWSYLPQPFYPPYPYPPPPGKNCGCTNPPPPKGLSFHPTTISGDDNTGVIFYVFTCKCPYKATVKGCLAPTISYFSKWEPIKGYSDIATDPTKLEEYFYCVCRYSDGTKTIIAASEGPAIIA